MWTIAYEARCYAAVALLGLLPWPTRGATAVLCGAVALALLVSASGIAGHLSLPPAVERNFGQIGPSIRFAGVFGTGALFYLLRHRIRWSGFAAFGAAGLLVLGLSLPHVAEPAFAICGGYLVFYAAFRMPVSPLSRFVDSMDLSYGLYLYAWPIACVFIFIDRDIDPWLLCVLTMGTSLIFGFASWHLVERPALRQAARAIAFLTHRMPTVRITPVVTLAGKP